MIVACFGGAVNSGDRIRFQVPTAETMKNVVFWGIKSSSYCTEDILRLRYTSQPVNATHDLRFPRR
jgi:hypothetical protein